MRRGVGKLLLPLLVAGVYHFCLSFSLPRSAEPRRSKQRTHAMAPTLEREVPMAPLPSNPSDPSLSQDDENRLRVNAGLPGQNVYALTTEADLAEMLERVSKEFQDNCMTTTIQGCLTCPLLHAAGQLLVVDYYAPWCRACQKLLRYMHKIAREEKFRNVEFASVDFDRSDDLVKSRSVNSLPTMEIYRGQELKQRWSGANTKRFLERLEKEVEMPKEAIAN
ncbi:unnamed protein product [Durusdinium trenchii]|uniref:Thioredoxin domain-containing protein n=1 Tax=Durusdinium trenchii TaxID=1381693 RepID=A0ABP0K3A6_9DINO